MLEYHISFGFFLIVFGFFLRRLNLYKECLKIQRSLRLYALFRPSKWIRCGFRRRRRSGML